MTQPQDGRVREIRERLEKATPGPWMPCLGSGMNECTAIHFEGNDQHPYGLFVCDLVPDWALDEKYKPDLEFKNANMEFISNAPEDIRYLLARLQKAEDALWFYADESIDHHNYHATMGTTLTERARSYFTAYPRGEG